MDESLQPQAIDPEIHETLEPPSGSGIIVHALQPQESQGSAETLYNTVGEHSAPFSTYDLHPTLAEGEEFNLGVSRDYAKRVLGLEESETPEKPINDPAKRREILGYEQQQIVKAGYREKIGLLENEKQAVIDNLVHELTELQRTAFSDPVSQEFNRLGLQHKMQELESERLTRPFVLVYVDLDNFKGVNDKSGHQYGDDVLREFSIYLRANLRPNDVVAHISRFGGDEFILILDPSVNQNDDKRQSPAENFRTAGEQEEKANALLEEYPVTFRKLFNSRMAEYPELKSVGFGFSIATVKVDKGKSFEQAIQEADERVAEEKIKNMLNDLLRVPEHEQIEIREVAEKLIPWLERNSFDKRALPKILSAVEHLEKLESTDSKPENP